MTDQALRARVQRLLRDDFRTEDVTRLFLALRDRSFGRQTVIEIGNFVAHSGERTRGLVTQRAKDWFSLVRFYWSLGEARTYDLDDLPANFPGVLRAAFEMLPAEESKKQTGLSRQFVGRLVQAIIRKMRTKPDGHLSVRPDHQESSLIDSLIATLRIYPFFDDGRLFDEFCEALERNKLLLPDERSSFSAVKPGISLFAITAMHQCKIDLGDGTYATLQAACGDGVIKVSVTAEVTIIFVRRSLFATTLSCADHCTPELLALESWDFPLDLTAERKLGILQ